VSEITHGLTGGAQSEDFTAYQSKKKGKRKVRLIVAGALIVMIGVLMWLVWFSPVLAVKVVQVVDSVGESLSADQIAQVQLAANISLQEPMAKIDTETAAQAVVDLPWVKAVDVRRGWPNEVVVAVEMRIPFGRINDISPGQAVDAQGFVFESSKTQGLPLIQATGASLISAVEVLANLPVDLARKVVRVRAESIDSIELDLQSGSTVRWGSADEPEFKAAVLEALLMRRAQIYDVSAPELPTTMDEKGPKKS